MDVKNFVACKDNMTKALGEIGTWSAKEHIRIYLNLEDDDPLVELLTARLVALKLEAS